MGIRRKHIRDLTQKLIQRYNPDGVPVDIKRIAKSLGIEVKLERVDDDLSGFLLREHRPKRTVIGANSAHHPNRQNFTIAHELGHYFLHESESVHLDERKPGFVLQKRDSHSATGTSISEQEANLFAAELLMPAKYLEKDLFETDIDLLDESSFLKKLAKKYGVSEQALTIRLDYLGYVRH